MSAHSDHWYAKQPVGRDDRSNHRLSQIVPRRSSIHKGARKSTSADYYYCWLGCRSPSYGMPILRTSCNILSVLLGSSTWHTRHWHGMEYGLTWFQSLGIRTRSTRFLCEWTALIGCSNLDLSLTGLFLYVNIRLWSNVITNHPGVVDDHIYRDPYYSRSLVSRMIDCLHTCMLNGP